MTTPSGYALITGASSGIGRALAFQLAKHGYNLILTSRNSVALELVASVSQEKYGVTAHVLIKDLINPEAVQELLNWIEQNQIKIEVLVNNAGFSVFGGYTHSSLQREREMVQLHVMTAMMLTKQLLPKMLHRKKGHILNISSIYAFAPVPFQSIYAATKSFLYSFSMALRDELEGTGVFVTVLCPGTTATRFRAELEEQGRTPEQGMSSDEVAFHACKAMFKHKKICIPGLKNKFYYLLMWFIPPPLLASVVRRINHKRNVNIRSKKLNSSLMSL